MKIDLDDGEDEAAINMTPMVDVVFQMLIFFMLATTYKNIEKEMNINLPESKAAAPAQDQQELVINVFRDGKLVMGRAQYDPPGLEKALSLAADANHARPVMIRGDRDAAHGKIVEVMGLCKGAGFDDIAIGTLQESK